MVFLRGAMDGLGALIPSDESAYYDKRPGIAVRRDGQIDLNGQFALHDALRPLKDIYDQGELAFVVGTGLDTASTTRSHFDAQARMEGGCRGGPALTAGSDATFASARAGTTPSSAASPSRASRTASAATATRSTSTTWRTCACVRPTT